jgi:hypothetical protein
VHSAKMTLTNVQILTHHKLRTIVIQMQPVQTLLVIPECQDFPVPAMQVGRATARRAQTLMSAL